MVNVISHTKISTIIPAISSFSSNMFVSRFRGKRNQSQSMTLVFGSGLAETEGFILDLVIGQTETSCPPEYSTELYVKSHTITRQCRSAVDKFRCGVAPR